MTTPSRLAAAMLIVVGLASPAVTEAQERRGSRLIVTKLDGTQAAGELIAVKPDSLLLLTDSSADLTIALTDIQTVRVVRKSRALPLAIAGFLAGTGEAIWITQREPESETRITLFWVAIAGGAQALLGTGIGLGLGIDAVIPFAGEPDEAVQGYLKKLRGRSREGRRLVPLGLETRRTGPSRLHRFRLAVGECLNIGNDYSGFDNPQGSWRFTGDVPAEEAGSYALTFARSGPRSWDHVRSGLRPGPISLAYEWTKRWLVEIEWFHASGWANSLNAAPTFVSTADGKTYTALIPEPADYRDRIVLDSVLAGLDYRLVVPDRLSRMSFEVGAAAGPAFVRIAPAPGLLPPARKAGFSLRLRAAFDYFFVPAFSLGLFADWRYALADLAPVTVTGEMAFHDDPYPFVNPPLVRGVEVNFPGRSVEQNRFLIGARVTFRL